VNLAKVTFDFTRDPISWVIDYSIGEHHADRVESGSPHALLPVSAGATVEAERVEWCSACRGEHSGTRADGMGLCGHPKEQVWVVRETRTKEKP